MTQIRFIDAITDALRGEMASDPSVIVLGEDVTMGGPFGATKGLVDEFGETRIRNTPISEGTVVGMATGAALTGLRPVVEVMFVDFVTLAMDQLVNHAAKLRYMSGGQLSVPLTIRIQGGIAGAMGAHHSQSLEAWFLHVPGLRVVAPSTPADAEALLRAAIRCDDPVLYLEHRGLYWNRGDNDEVKVPWDRALTRREGEDITIVAWSRMVGVALEAAEELAAAGISSEVIDARTITPLDIDTILNSVRKTRHLVVVHEAVETGGVGAEIAARVQGAAWDVLDGPVERIAAPFAPVPASPELERGFAPDQATVAERVKRMLNVKVA